MVKRVLITLWLLACVPTLSSGAQPTELEEQVRVIAADLRCPVCQNLSAADSPSELAQQMRAIIKSQLEEGKTPDQVRAFFVSKYGEWVLLSPTKSGFSLLVWVLPYLALAGGLIFVVFVIRRWARAKPNNQSKDLSPDLLQRIQKDLRADKAWDSKADIEGPHGPLFRERARLYTELRDLEFDYQAGRISKTDYEELRRGYEEQASVVLKELDTISPATLAEPAPESEPMGQTVTNPTSAGSRRTWIFPAIATFLLIFGVTLGVLLSNSLRTRTSTDDSITGDFLTGTSSQGDPSGSTVGAQDLPSLLAQGRGAFERQEWPKAIDAFKRILAMDANQPEANSYMGLILADAGHADSALTAFDRALSINPNYPLALLGSGMVLYRQKGDTDGGSQRLKKLLGTLPPGPEKEQLKKTIAEMGKGGDEGEGAVTQAGVPKESVQGAITGTIAMDPKLKSQQSGQGVLFIIARSAGTQGGPPLAVRRFERPAFPFKYSLGQDNTMIPGTQFKGKMVITARLDKDGNPVTRGAGDLTGAYKNNPVDVDSQKQVDIVLDQKTP